MEVSLTVLDGRDWKVPLSTENLRWGKRHEGDQELCLDIETAWQNSEGVTFHGCMRGSLMLQTYLSQVKRQQGGQEQ